MAEQRVKPSVWLTGKPVLLVLASTYPRWPDDPEPGFVHELCRRLTNRFDVLAVVPGADGASESEIMDGVQVIRYRYAPRRWQSLVNDGGIVANLRRHRWKHLLVPGFILGQYFAVRRVLKTHRVDVIHSHWLIPQGMVAKLLGAKYHTPYVVTSHGGDLYGLKAKFFAALKRWVAKSARAMTVVSSAMRDEAIRLGISSDDIPVIPMGVDLFGRFVPDESRQRDKNHLLFVGRLVEKKGLIHLLRAMPKILKVCPDAKLTIVGFGPEESSLRAQADRLGITEKVTFAGALAQQALPDWYRRASVFVAPFIRDTSGDQEGLPVAMMEALACGTPVVVGDVAGVDELLDSDASSIKVNPNDTDAMANLILDTLGNPEKAKVRAAKLRNKIMQDLDWTIIAESYAEVLAKGCACSEKSQKGTLSHE